MKPSVIRFICNGLVATGIHTLVVYLCIKYYYLDIGLVNVLAFLTATAYSYLANTRWTFNASCSFRVAYRYLIVTGMMSIVTYLLARACEAAGLSWGYGVALIVMITPILSWKLHKNWTYRFVA